MAVKNSTTVAAHWGEWIRTRSKTLGFVRQQDLADSLGCSSECLCRWLKLPECPPRMLKGLDAKLCNILQLSRYELTNGFRTMPPDAKLVNAPVGADRLLHDDDSARRKVIAAAELLSGERLLALRDSAMSLIGGVHRSSTA